MVRFNSTTPCSIFCTSNDTSRPALKDFEKLEYLNAVKCLLSKPSKLSNLYATQNHYDDFVANHIWATLGPPPENSRSERLRVLPVSGCWHYEIPSVGQEFTSTAYFFHGTGEYLPPSSLS